MAWLTALFLCLFQPGGLTTRPLVSLLMPKLLEPFDVWVRALAQVLAVCNGLTVTLQRDSALSLQQWQCSTQTSKRFKQFWQSKHASRANMLLHCHRGADTACGLSQE